MPLSKKQEYDKKRYNDNQEKLQEQQRQYRLANAEKVKATRQAYDSRPDVKAARKKRDAEKRAAKCVAEKKVGA